MRYPSRFKKPIEGEVFRSEYDIQSDIIQDPITRNTSPLVVNTIDLSVAGTRTFKTPGRAFVGYFFQTNTANKLRQLSGSLNVWLNGNLTVPSFPAKHNRGFRGSFSELYITWNAQANTSVDFVILRSKNVPWMSDDIDVNQLAPGFYDSPMGAGANWTLTVVPTNSSSYFMLIDGIAVPPSGFSNVGVNVTFIAPWIPVAGQRVQAWINGNTGPVYTTPMGAGAVWTLPRAPSNANSYIMFIDGDAVPPSGFSNVGTTVTFIAPWIPVAGQRVQAWIT